jgi:hypothetical protein
MTLNKTLWIAAALALCAGAASAQTELKAALDSARASVKGMKTCDEGRELDVPLELVMTPASGGPARTLAFAYAGCEWTDRNDYLPPYTERSYEAKGGYALTIVTDEGRDFSEVLLSRNGKWIGSLGTPANAALASGDPVSLGAATLRNASKPLFPQLKACEAADWSKAAASAPAREDGKPATGWEGRMGPSLVLLTKTAAYYYHEDCDICAEITRCELSTGGLSSFAVAHMLDCSDLVIGSTMINWGGSGFSGGGGSIP